MKKHFSRITSIFLAMAIILGMIPLMVSAGQLKETVFADDFESADKVWTVHPAYPNTFLTEENDGTYDFMRINNTSTSARGGAYSYAVPVKPKTEYTVTFTYKTPQNPTIYCYSLSDTNVFGSTLHSSNQNIDNGTASWLTKSVNYTTADNAAYMYFMPYIQTNTYMDIRSVVIKETSTSEVVENFELNRGWNYYGRPGADDSISYGKLHSNNSTNVVNFKTGSASNGLRSPAIPVTAGEEYQISFGYSSHKNTNIQIEYWAETGPVATNQNADTLKKVSVSGYNGFNNPPAITVTAPQNAKYMTLMFYDQYYNFYLDNVKIDRVTECKHPETESIIVYNGDKTHTEKIVCKACGDVLSEVIGACADGEDQDTACDVCGYYPGMNFCDDFESADKVWTVHPAYPNTFLTEENDGTYDFMRINNTSTSARGGAYSYAVPVKASTTYTVTFTYKTPQNPTIYCYSLSDTNVLGTALGSSNQNIDNGTANWLTKSVNYTTAAGAEYMYFMPYIQTNTYMDIRSVVITETSSGTVVENFELNRGWNYYTSINAGASISYGKLHGNNSTNVVNFTTGSAANGLRSPAIPVTAGEEYKISFGYSSHKNTNIQIEYWAETGPVASNQNADTLKKVSVSGYNGFNNPPAITVTAPANAKYMTLMFYDQYYNFYLDNVKVYQELPSIVMGDATGNGTVDILDVIKAKKYIAGVYGTAGADVMSRLDFDKNNALDSVDLASVISIILSAE